MFPSYRITIASLQFAYRIGQTRSDVYNQQGFITHARGTGRQKQNKLSFLQHSLSVMASATTYPSSLNSDDRKKYEQKLVTADGTVLPDPYTLVENWKDNMKLLPDITWADIYNYLINTPSLYTNENLKAYVFRSLQLLRFWSCTRCCISWN